MLCSSGSYAKWLHTRWPAGVVEKLPEVDANYRSNVPGLYIVGDLTGIPLLKFSSDSGARAVEHIRGDPRFQQEKQSGGDGEVLDVAIVGAGVSGMAAALAAREAGLSFELFEATEPFSTVVNFPRGKPIFTYPTEMVPAGDLQFTAEVKEPLVAELKAQTLEKGIAPTMARVEQVRREDGRFELVVPGRDAVRARRVVVAIGRSGTSASSGSPGRSSTRSPTGCTTPRITATATSSSSAAATAPSKPPSPSPSPAGGSPSPTASRSSPGPSRKTSRNSKCCRPTRWPTSPSTPRPPSG